MAPPIPAKCDACAKPLADPALVCSRCKAYAYCDETCQRTEWSVHKTGCSALPVGKLVRTEIERSAVREREVDKLSALLEAVAEAQEALDPSLSRTGADKFVDLATKGKVAAFNNLINYRLPPVFATPPIPGSSGLSPTSPKLLIRQIARLFLLHDLSALSSTQAHALLTAGPPANPVARFLAAGPSGPGTPPPGRVYAPKVLAVPDRLSMDEYGALTRTLPFAVADRRSADRWARLAQTVMLVWSMELGTPSEGG